MTAGRSAVRLVAEEEAEWVEVCGIDDLLPWYGACALVRGRQVAIFRVGEGNDLHALDNYDPIGRANVLSRGIVGDIGGELCVASPLYKQHFSLRTGQCLEQQEVSVPVYGVRVVDGRVQIGVA